MDIPTLDTTLPPQRRWVDMLRRHPDLEDDWQVMLDDFSSQAETIIKTTIKTPLGRLAKWLHARLNSRTWEFNRELAGVARHTGADPDVILAGQLVYDASTAGGISAVCGCTSAAQLLNGRPWHGRLMDWSWPESIRGRVRLIRVKTRWGSYMAEHIPGVTGFVGAYTDSIAANLNQAPSSGVRWNRLPALWWFRDAFERGYFDTPGHAPPGGMTDALVHVTRSRSRLTDRFYYIDGEAYARRDRLSETPVVLANSYDMEIVDEDTDSYAWSIHRERSVVRSRRRDPMRRLEAAECEDTVHRWSVTL